MIANSAAVPIAVVKYNPIIANKIDIVTKTKLAMTNEINDLLMIPSPPLKNLLLIFTINLHCPCIIALSLMRQEGVLM